MTSPSTIAKLEELLGEASPGKWSACNDGNCPCGFVWSESADSCLFKAFTEWGDGPGMIYGANTKEARTANMQLICLLRNSIQGILEERKRMREALQDIEVLGNDAYQPKGTIDEAIEYAKTALAGDGGE